MAIIKVIISQVRVCLSCCSLSLGTPQKGTWADMTARGTEVTPGRTPSHNTSGKGDRNVTALSSEIVKK